MQIENAFVLGLVAFISGLAFIMFVHVSYFPKKLVNSAEIPTFPPLIMLFSLNLGFLIGISNLYVFQLYKLPSIFDVFRSYEFGILILIISFGLIHMSVGLFKRYSEDPNPTTESNKLITGGIYKYTRNPMYLALVIFQVGVGMSLSFIHISLTAPLTMIVLHYSVIRKEEAYLKIKFDNAYENYKTKSRRWI
tara:strand:- start:179 stop:757 length:579 start_codon:yes stop_codon:yes gene_type:complete